MSELALYLIAKNIEKHQCGEDASYLDLGNCGLTQIPMELGECVWLETLTLSDTWWEYDIEENKGKIRYSQNKSENNQITTLSPSLAQLSNLRTLVLSGNPIQDLSSLAGLLQLQKLFCNSTQVSDLSPLAGLLQLQQLNCSHTQVRDLSPLSGLLQLKELSCSSTQVSDLSPLAGLLQLQQINCSSTQVSDLSPLAGLFHLQKLLCTSTQVSDLSPLARLLQLQQLGCSSTQVSDLSPLARLLQLQQLGCSSTQVSDLSPLAGLLQLQQINCSSTQVSNLSPLAGLLQLQELDCTSTKVNDLSPLAGLLQLQILDCSNTQVSDLSPLAGLIRLQILYCYSTQVSDLSPLAGLIQLQKLDCSFTQVSDLSPLFSQNSKPEKGQELSDHTREAIANRQKRLEIGVEDCPLTNPPIEIVKQGNKAIINYFAEKERTGTEKSLEAKVVLIGEGQAGKTSLRTRLLRPGEALPKKEDRTKGLDIEIEKYQYPLTNGERMRLNVFDFGGQDHYKPLHQFFYSKNTLYVLVSKNGDVAVNDFDFWLDTAQLFGQRSPVLLVHNLFGDVRSSFNRSKYERFEDTIKDCLDVNLADFEDHRWPEVQSRIEYFASRLPHVHEEIPKSWANVRRALLARRDEQVLHLEDYFALCALEENGAMDQARALRCSEYLHDIGVILHYQDDADLREYVIVRNEWATDAAYRVIDDGEIEKRNGYFSRQKDLPRIWHQPEYSKMRLQLLQLMRRFRLCYPLKAEDEYIAPQLLPVSPPEGYEWIPDQDLVVYVEYDFLPPGLMSQLIVECYLLIAGERRLVWRDGAVLELDNGEARAEILLQKRSGKQTIGIRAQGRKRRDLMTIVDTKLEELHKPFGDGLKADKKIPCICTHCAKTDDKWYFNLSELEKRQRAGRDTKECENSFEAVSINALLGNVFSEEVRQRGGKTAARVFFSYSKTDALYLQEFKKHLKTMERNGTIEPWDDTKIRPGEEWDEAIKRELGQAKVIFLLVSVDFLATNYIWEVELEEAMRRHVEREATVIPIKIRDCNWGDTAFGKLQGLPRKNGIIGPNPVNDTIWTQVVKEIGELLKGR
jgi:internalin A